MTALSNAGPLFETIRQGRRDWYVPKTATAPLGKGFNEIIYLEKTISAFITVRWYKMQGSGHQLHLSGSGWEQVNVMFL